MKVPMDKEKRLVTDLAGTCHAADDNVYMKKGNDSQCKNLLQRLPLGAREYIEKNKLVGKEGGSFSRGANGHPGPKD
jgi:hypothetical protein